MNKNIFKDQLIASDVQRDGDAGIGSHGDKKISESNILNLIACSSNKKCTVLTASDQSSTTIYATEDNEIRLKTQQMFKVEIDEDIFYIQIAGDVELTNNLNETIKNIVLNSTTDKS